MDTIVRIFSYLLLIVYFSRARLCYRAILDWLASLHVFSFEHLVLTVKLKRRNEAVKKHKSNDELSKTEHSRKQYLKNTKKVQILSKMYKILRFQDLLRLNNCLYLCVNSQFEQNLKLAATISGIVYSEEKHNYNTRRARKSLLNIPLCQAFTYVT